MGQPSSLEFHGAQTSGNLATPLTGRCNESLREAVKNQKVLNKWIIPMISSNFRYRGRDFLLLFHLKKEEGKDGRTNQ